MEKAHWAKPKAGTLVLWDRKNQNNPKCPYRRLGCIGRLYLADRNEHPNQAFCDFCGATWINPLKLSLDKLSDYKLSRTDENWWWRLVATKKISIPTKKPGRLKRFYLQVRWHI